jgi:hypothetical protein
MLAGSDSSNCSLSYIRCATKRATKSQNKQIQLIEVGESQALTSSSILSRGDQFEGLLLVGLSFDRWFVTVESATVTSESVTTLSGVAAATAAVVSAAATAAAGAVTGGNQGALCETVVV